MPDPDGPERQPTSELWGPWEQGSGSGQESRSVSGTQFKKPVGFDTPTDKLSRPATDAAPNIHVDPQTTYREHVSGSLASHPSEAPLFQPAYPPYPPYPGYQPQGYSPQGHNYPPPSPNYAPFGGYPPQRPGYTPNAGYPSYQGYVSPPPNAPIAPPYSGYNGYANIYAYPWQPPLLKRDTYLLAIGITSLVGSILLVLAGLGAIGLLALIAVLPHTTLSASQYFASIMLFIGFACAGVVGGGFGLYHSIRSVFLRGVGLAAVFEFILELLLVHGQVMNPLLCVDQPNAPNCQNPGVYNIILLVVAVMAPLIEESVKPLAVIVFIGRLRSAAEAFVLGLAAGIGFNLIETTGYISSSYQDWLSIALIRTGAGLLHGFGAAMVTLGWYYLTRPGKHRVLKAAGCWIYAVLQHAVWNGSWGLTLLPAPVGSFFNNTNVTIGSLSLPSYAIVNIVEALFMLAFFIYMTGKLRTKQPPSPFRAMLLTDSI